MPTMKTPNKHENANSALSSAPCSVSVEQMLIDDNKRLREAGCELAEAAMRVAKTYDGVHRLMIASSKWAMAIANEGGREKLYSQNNQGQVTRPDSSEN